MSWAGLAGSRTMRCYPFRSIEPLTGQLSVVLLFISYPSAKGKSSQHFSIIIFGACRPKRVYLGFIFQKARVSNRNNSCHKCILAQLQYAWLFLVRLDFTAVSVLKFTDLENICSHVSLQALFYSDLWDTVRKLHCSIIIIEYRD